MTNLIHINDTELSDAYKEAYGVRPRGVYKEWWTKADLKAEYDYLADICKENMEIEKEAEIKALKEFKRLIKDTMKYGADSRNTAIKWLLQAEGIEMYRQDLEYFFWLHGLSYRVQRTWARALLSNN